MASAPLRNLLAVAALSLACAACATGPTGATRPMADAKSCVAKAWWKAERAHYGSDEEARNAYQALAVANPSPWPVWYHPGEAVLQPGVTFFEVLSPGQPDEKPGGFGTFDVVRTPAQARNHLAIRSDWKPAFDRVVIYQVTRPIRVRIGPIGPQLDARTCAELKGDWSQIELLEPGDRMGFLKPVGGWTLPR